MFDPTVNVQNIMKIIAAIRAKDFSFTTLLLLMQTIGELIAYAASFIPRPAAMFDEAAATKLSMSAQLSLDDHLSMIESNVAGIAGFGQAEITPALRCFAA